MIGNIIGGFVTVMIGTSLLGPVANAVTAAQTGNVTGASSTIVGLTTLFFSLGVMSSGIGITVQGLRSAGAM